MTNASVDKMVMIMIMKIIYNNKKNVSEEIIYYTISLNIMINATIN